MDKFVEMYGQRPDGRGGLPTMATRAQDMWDALHAAYSIGRCEEREACAKVCDANAEHWRGMYTTANPRATELVLRGYSAREDSAADCATNIRQRSNALAQGPGGSSPGPAGAMG